VPKLKDLLPPGLKEVGSSKDIQGWI